MAAHCVQFENHFSGNILKYVYFVSDYHQQNFVQISSFYLGRKEKDYNLKRTICEDLQINKEEIKRKGSKGMDQEELIKRNESRGTD